jgi:hypothetical protein
MEKQDVGYDQINMSGISSLNSVVDEPTSYLQFQILCEIRSTHMATDAMSATISSPLPIQKLFHRQWSE